LIKLVFAFLIPQTLKKGQKKSKNKFDQEETTDAWGFEKPSTSGIPQTLKKGQKKSKNKFAFL
jgi:hypothetical protein